MSWDEVASAKKEGKRELVLNGPEITKRIVKSGLDLSIFDLTSLNYLDIHDTGLEVVPDAIQKLINLQTLVLHSNKIVELPDSISKLTKLKILDVSRNCLTRLTSEIGSLSQLTILNVSDNQLEEISTLSTTAKLSVLNISNNRLQTFPDICYNTLSSLSELLLSNNEIEVIPHNVSMLTGLKVLYLNVNKIETIPGEVYDCNKLKEVNFKDNPITDKRLLKLIVQCHTKQVLDYIKQNCARKTPAGINNKKGGDRKSSKPNRSESITSESVQHLYKILIRHFSDTSLKIVVKDDVKDVRPHIIACIITNLQFNEDNFKKFIQLQTKLHDTLCDKRNVATIATHDLQKLGAGDLVYTARLPNELIIKPLNRAQLMSGAQLFNKLQAEADAVRKEKKRNTYSGIHKYLYLLEGKSKYPCLLNGGNEVISFPPMTNSDTTKMGLETTSLLVEITSVTSQTICKKIADTLIKEMLPIFGNSLTVQQVRNVDVEGNLKTVYPSRSDMVYEDSAKIAVERE